MKWVTTVERIADGATVAVQSSHVAEVPALEYVAERGGVALPLAPYWPAVRRAPVAGDRVMLMFEPTEKMFRAIAPAKDEW